MVAHFRVDRTVAVMLTELISAFVPHTGLALLGAGLGAAAGAALPSWAAVRTTTRPVALALESETTVLAGVLADLRRYPYVATISAPDFAANHDHNIWAALLETLGEAGNVSPDVTDADCAELGEHLVANTDTILTGLAARLQHTNQPEVDLARVRELLAHADEHGYGREVDETTRAAADTAVVAAAEAVLGSGNDRNRLSGKAPILPTASPNSLTETDPPLARVLVAPTRSRRALTGVAGAAMGLLMPGIMAVLPVTGLAAIFALAALVTLAVSSIVISLVDLDTLYIDMPVWAVSTALGWTFAAGSAIAYGQPSRMLYGIGLVIGTVVLFEGTNFVFKLLRGMDGQGFGDTLIIVATVGIPPVLTADYRIGYWAVMGGLVAGALGWFVARLLGKVTRHTPFAFGPWLSAGWVLAMAWFVYDTTFMLSVR